MQNLDQDSFRSFSVPRLPLCQQDRIANFLDEQTARIDALIAEKERIVTSLKDFDEVTAFDLATRGTAPLAERTAYPEPWLTGVPAHWKLSKLRYLTHIGNGSTPKRDNAEYWEGGSVPWLNSGSVTGSRVCEPSDLVTESARKQCHLPMVRQGSTLVALTGQGKTRGSAALLEFDSTINQHLAYLSSFDKALTDEYLWVALTGFYSVLRYISDDGGSTKGALTCEQLSQLRIPIPPLGEQSRIVSEYKSKTLAVAQLLANVWKHINRLREYRSSLISATVTGQLNIDEFQARQLEVA
jgi:type I restriction enzyme S subunit